MTKTTSNFRTLLLASTALVAAGFVSTASAADSTITITDGTMSVDAALAGFVSATSQIADGTVVDADVAASGSQINKTEATDITTNQTIFGESATAEARLNQGTNTLTVSAPDGSTLTGSTDINNAASGTVSIDVASGILSQQNLVDSGTSATGAVTADTGTATGTVGFNVALDTPSVSGNVTNSGNVAVADALANDVVNTLSVTGGGTGSPSSPAAIANLQSVAPNATAGDLSVAATTFGDVTVKITDTTTSPSAISGDITLDQNTVASRAAANTAVNDLFAGTADNPAQGALAGDLGSAAVETTGEIGAFVADFGVANLQTISESAGTGTVTITADTTGVVAVGVDSGAAITSDNIVLRNNAILSDAAGNTATNRGIATTSGINGVSVGVASLQEFTGGAAVDEVVATTALGTVSFGNGVSGAPLTGGSLTGVDVTLSDNQIGATASGNEATNVAAVTSTGIEGSQSFVAGRQVATDVGIKAVNTAANIVANVESSDATSNLILNNNDVFSTAALNTQTNVLQNTGSSNLGTSTMVSTSQQEISGGSSTATITLANIAAMGSATSVGASSLTGNTVLASATGNVSTTSITNRTSSGFSFTR
ncbi:MAG: beta strand repeat-containing protein [Marivita sp.]|uniref:beta strand repeat-containing protein n=1 Tax=Marivita sp. TaxID=2003365 RepID=UPI003EF6B469